MTRPLDGAASPPRLTVRHGRKAARPRHRARADNLRVKLSPWPRYRLVRGEADRRGGIKRGIILKYGQIKTAGYDLRDVPVVRSGYASALQTTDLRPAFARIDAGRGRRGGNGENRRAECGRIRDTRTGQSRFSSSGSAAIRSPSLAGRRNRIERRCGGSNRAVDFLKRKIAYG